MGLRDWFSRSGDGDSDTGDGAEESESDDSGWTRDHWAVRYSPHRGGGGWATVEHETRGAAKEFGYPMGAEEFRVNYGELDPGTYRLFAVDSHGRLHDPPEEHQWKLEVSPDTGEQSEETRRLERKFDRLEQKLDDDDENAVPTDPDMALKQMQAQFAMQALQSPEFVKRYGEKIAMSAFDIGDSGSPGDDGIGFDDWQDSPVGATIYQMMEEPQKAEELGEAFGGMGGKMLEGFSRGMGDTPSPLPSGDDAEGDTADSEADSDDAGVDSGPSTFDDLGTVDGAPDTETAAQTAAAAATQAERGQRRSATDDRSTQSPPDASADLTGDAPADFAATDTERDTETTDQETDTDTGDAPGDAADTDDDAVDQETDADTGDTLDAKPAGDPTETRPDDVPNPATPSELSMLGWTQLQKLASFHGINPSEFNKKTLAQELQTVEFDIDRDATVDDEIGADGTFSPGDDPEAVASEL